MLVTARPRVSVEILALLASLFFALVSNRAFWHAARTAEAFEGPNGAVVAVSVFTLLVCVHLILLCVVLHRATAKVLLTLLLVAAAVISHASSVDGAYLAPEAMRVALQSNLLASSQVLSWEFARTLVAEAVVPALLLWRVQITRVPFPEATARRVVTVALASALAMLAARLPHEEIGRLMRDHKALRYLVTPSNLMAAVALRVGQDDDTQAPTDRVVVPASTAPSLPPN